MLINIEGDWNPSGYSHNCDEMAVMTGLSVFVNVCVYAYSQNDRAKMLLARFRQKQLHL